MNKAHKLSGITFSPNGKQIHENPRNRTDRRRRRTPGGSTYQQLLGVYLRRIEETREAGHEHEEGDDNEEDGVDEAGEDLYAVVTEDNDRHVIALSRCCVVTSSHRSIDASSCHIIDASSCRRVVVSSRRHIVTTSHHHSSCHRLFASSLITHHLSLITSSYHRLFVSPRHIRSQVGRII